MRRFIAALEVDYWWWWEQRSLPETLAAWVLRNRYRAERYHHPEVFSKVKW